MYKNNNTQQMVEWVQRKSPWVTMENENAPSTDPRKFSLHRIDDSDIRDHHLDNSSSYSDLSLLNGRKLSHGDGLANYKNVLTNNHRNKSKGSKLNIIKSKPAIPPAQRVQFLLGQEGINDDEQHRPHPIFSEMEELTTDADGNLEWKETARWVKFEEDVELGGNKWSKPHVATLSLHSLFELRHNLLSGSVLLDMQASTLEDIADLAIEDMVNSNILPYDKREFVKDAILKRHRHQFEGLSRKRSTDEFGEHTHESGGRLPLIRSLAEIGRRHTTHFSKPNFIAKATGSHPDLEAVGSTANVQQKANIHFMKKIPKDAEASNVLVGKLNSLEKPISCFIRLNEATDLGDLTEVPIPTRFLFIYIGPSADKDSKEAKSYHEVGRSVATIMADDVFHDIAYRATKREHLLTGIDEFLDSVTVLPPGEWDPSIRIEPPNSVPSQDARKRPQKSNDDDDEDEEKIRMKERETSGLIWSGKFCGGLINDIKRKYPFYLSDYKDALNAQCLASFVFIYFAVLAPVITFGGLLGEATEHRISVIEAMVGGMFVGVAYGLFSGQPLSILGPTGPILVFETIIYKFCKSYDWDFLPFRLWIGIWAGFILLIAVATDSSALVCLITRFTEENFAMLIAVIFIKSAFDKVINIGNDYPIHPSPCECIPKNFTLDGDPDFTPSVWTYDNESNKTCQFVANFSIVAGEASKGCHYVPNVLMTSVVLFAGTYLMAVSLKKMKTSNFFPAYVKTLISDFAVIIALLVWTLVDFLLAVDTPKLSVPSNLQPTWEGRGWVIEPLGRNPWWTILAAFIPALLVTILIFMDQQITVVIVNRKEHRLKKGCGYHLDLFVVAIMIILCSVMGFPWCEASTVPSINHVRSLMRESETSAPGEKPTFLGIREQRLTHVMVFIFIGVSVFIAPVLSYIPMPVLFGVFLYMGTASLDGLQFFDRVCLFFMPQKYQPDMPYLRRVPIRRVHFFTIIQIACLSALWIIKDIKSTSILFPIMLLFLIAVRKGMDFVFSKDELTILDDIFPSFKRSQKLDNEDQKSTKLDSMSLRIKSTEIEVPMANGNVLKIPIQGEDSGINITEEMNKSGVWTSLAGTVEKERSHRRRHKKHKKKMYSVEEEEEEEEVKDKHKKITRFATTPNMTGHVNKSFQEDNDVTDSDEEDQGLQLKVYRNNKNNEDA